MRTLLGVLLILAALVPLPAIGDDSPLRMSAVAGANLANDIPCDSTGLRLFDDLGMSGTYEAAHILIHLEGGITNDGAFSPEESFLAGHHIDLRDAFVDLHTDRFGLTVGRYAHADAVDSPYSLFVTSRRLPALAVDARYEDDRFFYESRWVQLNHLSALYEFPVTGGRLDRGMNYKVYALKFGNVRFGLQDSIIYVGRSFDAEFFLNPMFQYVQQLVRSTAGKPGTETSNCNSLNGFFVDMTGPRSYWYAQILVDDVNLDFLGFWGPLKMPNKLAWSLGGHVDLSFGTLGAYAAGATKYTFEATYATSGNYSLYPYEYAYFPDSEYQLADGSWMTLDYTLNYIGYKYGENALSVLVDYRMDFAPAPVTLTAALEYVVNGSKSPSNPWHELYSWTQLDYLSHSHTYFLEDPQLEHTVLGTVDATFRLGSFDVSARVRLGGRWNTLQLVDVVAGEPGIFMPVGADRFLYELRVGVRWHFLR